MIKTAISLVFLSFILINCKQDPTNQQSQPSQPAIDSLALEDELEEKAPGTYFLKRYDGTLDGKLPISMVLINWGDGFMSGRYWQQGTSKIFSLSGELSDSLSFKIAETVKFKETGTFEGTLDDPSHLSGTWFNPKRSKKMAFDLREIPASDTLGWTGNWHLSEVWDEGLLLIGNVTADSFDFALSIFRSSHVGTLEGRAKFNDSKAFYNLKDFEDEPCKLNFELNKDLIVVSQGSSNFACGFGARANADGKYEKKNWLKKAKLAYGNSDDAIFPNQPLHDSFKALVGKNAYAVFAYNMQLIDKSKNEAPEKIKATVAKGFISGMVGSNEAVIMYDGQGKIYAATIDFDKTNNESLVRYFTNDPLYRNRLPLTIEEWREGFKNYRLVFEKQPL